ncbi:tetratricopeptide repeat protein [Candidatus Sumerlaeota bacterium]|nr:tetratricopeptide repeat protein [Candidatus Sumerlaeota bacterium]
MRTLFALIVVSVLIGAVWLSTRYADRVHCRMMLNKATRDFLRDEKAKAIDDAIELLDRHPGYRPALDAAVAWLTSGKQFARALEVASAYVSDSLPAQTRYHVAVCAHEVGDESEATRLFRTMAGSTDLGRDIPSELVRAYLAVSQGNLDSARTTLEATGDRFDGNILYHSLYGRVCYARGDVARAAEQLGRAVELGEANPRTFLCLVNCLAMQGDLPGAQRLLDSLEASGIDAYSQASGEMASWLTRLKGRTYVSPDEYSEHRNQALRLHLANVCIDVHKNQIGKAIEALESLSREFPDAIGIATYQGLLHERLQRRDKALQLYRSEADRLFLAAYKLIMLDPASNATSESAILGRFLKSDATVFEARLMNPTAGRPADRGWVLLGKGEFSRPFVVHSTGRYSISLIARGSPAIGIWPIVNISIDDQPVAQQYINSPVWNLFEMSRVLLSGTHTIRLAFVNDDVAPGPSGGDRSFCLDRVIIKPVSN